MLRKKELIESIGSTLAQLKATIATLNCVRFFDLNVVAEDFFASLMNAVYGYSLVNLNHATLNAVAIDLGDKASRLAVQVTSERKKAKIQTTLNKFAANGLASDFDKLKFLILGDRTGNYPNLTVPKAVSFSGKDDVIDIATLMADISRLDVSKLETIDNLMRREISRPQSDKSVVTTGNNPVIGDGNTVYFSPSETTARKLDYLEKQVQEFYAPICDLALDNARRAKLAKTITNACLDSKTTISRSEDDQAIQFNNTLYANMSNNNRKIKEICDTQSYLMDAEDAEVFSQFQEDYLCVNASVVLPLGVSRELGAAYSFRDEFARIIADRLKEKKRLLDELRANV